MHFQRFTASDPIAHQKKIDELQAALNRVHCDAGANAALDIAIDLGEALTIAGREAEACDLLVGFYEAARANGNSSALGWYLLNLATANQYVGQKHSANNGFSEAVAIAQSIGDQDLEHYVWHHWGRSLTEEGEKVKAKACFEKALAIRIELKDPRHESTQRALAALSKLE